MTRTIAATVIAASLIGFVFIGFLAYAWQRSKPAAPVATASTPIAPSTAPQPEPVIIPAAVSETVAPTVKRRR